MDIFIDNCSKSLDTRVTGVEGGLAAEIERATGVEGKISTALSAEIAETAAEQAVQDASINSLEDADTAFAGELAEEARVREEKDLALGSRIDANDLDNANLTLSVN